MGHSTVTADACSRLWSNQGDLHVLSLFFLRAPLDSQTMAGDVNSCHPLCSFNVTGFHPASNRHECGGSAPFCWAWGWHPGVLKFLFTWFLGNEKYLLCFPAWLPAFCDKEGSLSLSLSLSLTSSPVQALCGRGHLTTLNLTGLSPNSLASVLTHAR
jgi:hypothetical protein